MGSTRWLVPALLIALAAAGAHAQCANDCGIGDVDEGEPCPTDEYADGVNGGCNWDPQLFSPASCGLTICGTAATYDFGGEDFRDTDWYLLPQAELAAADADGNGVVRMRATLTSEFSGLVGIFSFQPDCSNIVAESAIAISGGNCIDPGVTETLLAVDDHPFGIIVVAAPDVFDGVECATGLNDYTLLIECADPALGEAFPDTCLATGVDPAVDGYLQVCLDPYGAWASAGFGGSGDLFNPAGPPGAQPMAFTSGLFLLDAGTGRRELLANNLNWQSILAADNGLEREIVIGSIASDTNGDGVADRMFSVFRVSGTGISLRFYLEQRVESIGGGVSTLTQTYAVTNELAGFVGFDLVRHFDGDLVWAGTFADDSVGTGTIGSGADRFVFMQEAGDPTTAVTISSAAADPYYGAKNGVDPDGKGPGPAMGPGTTSQLWDAFGIPSTWLNYIAGVGADTNGESGAAPAGCIDPCDAHIALDVPIVAGEGFDPIFAIRHTFGDNVPVEIDPCGTLLSGSCGVANGFPGCDNRICCELVCAADPFCCDTEWDLLCVQQAADECGFVEDDADAAGAPNAETVGDLNGDGLADAVAVIPDFDLQEDGAVQAFLNLGTLSDGQWLRFVPLPPVEVGRSPTAVAAGLFNDDEHLDLAVTNGADGTVTILINSGLGNATFNDDPQTLAVGNGPSDIVALSPGPLTDLAVTLQGDGTFVILVNDGTGSFTVQAPPEGPLLGFGPVSLFSDDFDNNKCEDLTGSGQGGPGPGPQGKVFVALDLGGGVYDVIMIEIDGFPFDDPRDVATGDVNDDGLRDLVVADTGTGDISLVYGDGAGGFPTALVLEFEVDGQVVESHPTDVAVVDMNSDGCDGLAIADESFHTFGPSLLILPRGCGEEFTIGYVFSGADIPQDVDSADFNDDCVPDLVTANDELGGTGSVSTLLSTILPVLFPCPVPCPWDCQENGPDGTVGINDFLEMLFQWGDVGESCDFGLGQPGVGIEEFLALLQHWGPCPVEE